MKRINALATSSTKGAIKTDVDATCIDSGKEVNGKPRINSKMRERVVLPTAPQMKAVKTSGIGSLSYLSSHQTKAT